ncbi:MAG: NUDIX hydrolase [Isosphaeraceae bacterium]
MSESREPDPQPRPTRESTGSLALITRDAPEGSAAPGTLYLAQWNLSWRALNLVGGHREGGESFRDCLVREIGEELGLAEGEDFVVDDVPPVRLEFDAFSDSAWAPTAYRVEVYHVRLTGERALARVASNPDNRWVSHAEILAGRCNDGTHISPTTARVVTLIASARTA